MSASHLGRKDRSWRAALHLDESWLSREIVLVGAFLGVSSGMLVFGGLPSGLGWVAVAVVLVKLSLYLARKNDRSRLGLKIHPAVVWLRVAAPSLGMVALVGDLPWVAMVLILIGEIIDRGEFYVEVEIPTPNSLQLDELDARPEAHAVFGGE